MSKKKIYEPTEMINSSRYRDLFPTLSSQTQNAVLGRLAELIRTEIEFQDSGNYQHLCEIFSAIALYETLQSEGKSKEEAMNIISTAMYTFLIPSKRKFQKMAKVPGFLKLMGKLLPTMFAKGSGKGWKYQWTKGTNKKLYFECQECIYARIYGKYAPELGPMQCYADDINYGELPGIRFTRKHTLCKDGQNCDFLFEKMHK